MTKTEENEQADALATIDLKDPVLAAFLAWLLPGLGHLYQRRFAKAALFFVCIMGTFLFGLHLGSDNKPAIVSGHKIGWGRVVYWSWRSQHGVTEKRWHYFCQVGVGLPAMPAIFQSMRMRDGKKVLWGGFMAPPRIPGPDPESDLNKDQATLHDLKSSLTRSFDFGEVFTMIAGLLNVLAIYDAWGGPVFGEAAKEEDEEDEKDRDESDKDEKDPDQSDGDESKTESDDGS